MPAHYYDAHTHLCDTRLDRVRETFLAQRQTLQINRVVVSGTSETDWPRVHQLATRFPDFVIPTYGLHPWFAPHRHSDWKEKLHVYLASRNAGLGEIGIDKWKRDLSFPDQMRVFQEQLELLSEYPRPCIIHCLKAWDDLYGAIKQNPALGHSGFLLHSYSGPRHLIPKFAECGGWFSISGYFAQPRKLKQREILSTLPINRLLVETDSPDMLPPAPYLSHPIKESTSREPINHPANLESIYQFVANLFGLSISDFSRQIALNFKEFYGPLMA